MEAKPKTKSLTIKRKWFKTKEAGNIEENFKFNKTKDVTYH